MKHTANSHSHRERQSVAPPRNLCPLCQTAVEHNADAPGKSLVCPSCHLVFGREARPISPAHLEPKRSPTVEAQAQSSRVDDWIGPATVVATVTAAAAITPSPQRRGARFSRVTGLVAVSLVLLTGLSIGSFLVVGQLIAEVRQLRDANRVADQARQQAIGERDEAEQRVRLALADRLARSSQELLTESPKRSALLASEAVTVALVGGQPPAAQAEQTLRDALSTLDSNGLGGHTDCISAVAISADSRLLVTGSHDNTARLWDLSAKYTAAAPLVLTGHEGRISSICISHDNSWLVTGSYDGTARVWNLKSKDPTATPTILRGHNGRVTAVAISPDSRWLVTASGGLGRKDNEVHLWDLTSDDPAANGRLLTGHDQVVLSLAISSDSRMLLTGSADRTARLWDLTADDPSLTSIALTGHGESVQTVTFSPDLHWAITASLDSVARVWDLTAPNPAEAAVELHGHRGWIRALAVSPDSHWLVTAGEDKTARLWDLTLPDPNLRTFTLVGHEASIQAVAITPDSRRLATASLDKTARLWDLSAPSDEMRPIVLHGHDGPLQAIAISADNHWLVTGGDDHLARVWNLNLNELTDFARDLAKGDPVIEELRRCFLEPVTANKLR
ncbi:MAG: WD40 repeat domain-containing protein [Pirellulales bacterium]|nr:WD40 repeat domain-containing protein [Pirellulales bacterium]